MKREVHKTLLWLDVIGSNHGESELGWAKGLSAGPGGGGAPGRP
jgi:hypothetical protein